MLLKKVKCNRFISKKYVKKGYYKIIKMKYKKCKFNFKKIGKKR